jgi:hypothetical protein
VKEVAVETVDSADGGAVLERACMVFSLCLLGTVIGIVRAFHELNGVAGRVTSGLMAEVGEALVAARNSRSPGRRTVPPAGRTGGRSRCRPHSTWVNFPESWPCVRPMRSSNHDTTQST